MKRTMRRSAIREELFGYACVAPQLLGFLLFVLGPLVMVFVYGFQSRNLLTGRVSFAGLANYRALLGDPLFFKSLKNTLVFTLGLVPLNVAASLLLSLALAGESRVNSFFRTVFFAPVVTAAAAWAIVWKFLLQGDQGVVNQLLGVVGIAGPNWLLDDAGAMAAVIVTRVIKNLGMNIVIYLAAVTNLPHELYEAARIDGASAAQRFRTLTLPLLMPTTIMISIITMIGSLKVFDHIMLLTQGGPSNATMVLVYYIYFQGFKVFRTGYASALATILFAIVLGLTFAQWRLGKRLSYQEE
ncbi:MAG TPA: sugar ABC transporter permease [Spirochaetia bacterium]|nr:sugar ABC transporter permease [Spirochaetia bacterium]HRZ65674.1 sugar ABC transporter permease [Spirochaetia bacterium]